MAGILISVITVHRDDLEGLSTTMRSLERALADSRWEWIVVDGNSAPAAHGLQMESIRAKADRFVSEPDAGPYDAMNKGTAMAAGEWMLFLNAGDELSPGLDIDALPGLLSGPVDMVWGHCEEVYESGEVVNLNPRSPRLAWYGMPVNHQNILFRRSKLATNPYRLDLPISADYELVCRLLASGAKVSRSGMSIARFHRGGRSTQDFSAVLREEQHVRRAYFPVATWAGLIIMAFKQLNSRIARFPGLRRWWRKHV